MQFCLVKVCIFYKLIHRVNMICCGKSFPKVLLLNRLGAIQLGIRSIFQDFHEYFVYIGGKANWLVIIQLVFIPFFVNRYDFDYFQVQMICQNSKSLLGAYNLSTILSKHSHFHNQFVYVRLFVRRFCCLSFYLEFWSLCFPQTEGEARFSVYREIFQHVVWYIVTIKQKLHFSENISITLENRVCTYNTLVHYSFS